jgi:hypothetical protein
MRNTADVTGGKPISVLLQSISGVSAINTLVAFYDIHGGKREVLFFYFVPDTTRDLLLKNDFMNDFFMSRVIEWMTKNVLSRAPPCFGRHVKRSQLHLQSLAPTNPHWARVLIDVVSSVVQNKKNSTSPFLSWMP